MYHSSAHFAVGWISEPSDMEGCMYYYPWIFDSTEVSTPNPSEVFKDQQYSETMLILMDSGNDEIQHLLMILKKIFKKV